MIKGRHYEVDAPDGRSRLKVPHTFTRDTHRTSVLHARASEYQQSPSLPTLHHVDKLSFATIVLFFHPTRKEGGGSGGDRESAHACRFGVPDIRSGDARPFVCRKKGIIILTSPPGSEVRA